MAFLLIISALFHSERVKRTYDIKVVNEFSSEFLIEETNNYTIKRFFFFSENFQTTRLYFGNEGGFYRGNKQLYNQTFLFLQRKLSDN
jgi:hypothetical protein